MTCMNITINTWPASQLCMTCCAGTYITDAVAFGVCAQMCKFGFDAETCDGPFNEDRRQIINEQSGEIRKFFGVNAYLSNFHVAPFKYGGYMWTTVENAFQAMKLEAPEARAKFVDIPPGHAKRLGRSVRLRPDWEKIKVDVMRELVRCKFQQNTDLKLRLKMTGDLKLVEGNYWHDNIWGDCNCEACSNKKGRNLLGNILMQVREEIQLEIK